MAEGTWQISTRDKPMLQLTTVGLPMKMQVKAPITAGSLTVATDVDFALELSLMRLEGVGLMSKPVVTFARGIIGKYDADLLSFEAKAPGSAGPWELTGTAVSGDLRIPTVVVVTPSADLQSAHIGGTITLDDIEVSLPIIGDLTSITFTLDGSVRMQQA